jgi:hypothetical protein
MQTDSNLVIPAGVNSVEASELGLKPGRWPTQISDSRGITYTIHRKKFLGDELAAITYYSVITNRTITVWND